jgi:sugar diacid utilization regulator
MRSRAHEDRRHLHQLVQQLRSANRDKGRRAHAHEVLARGAISGGGEAAIAEALHELTGRSVMLEDRRGTLRAAAGPASPAPHLAPHRDRVAWRQDQAERGRHRLRDGDLLLATAAPHGEVLGALALVDPDHSTSSYDGFVLDQAAAILGIELLHQERLAAVRRTVDRDVVDDVVAGFNAATIQVRGDALGHDLRTPHRVALVHWRDATGEAVAGALAQALDELRAAPLLSPHDDGVVVLIDSTGAWDELGPWLDLHRRLAAALGSGSGSIGVGGPAGGPAELPRSHHDAGQALSIRLQSTHPFGVTRVDELGVYRILARDESRQDVGDFVETWLGELIAYDKAHDADLVSTVAAYCESGGNYDRTAQVLAIHRSTMRYRLGRIRDISGHDLNEVDTRFNLHVATRAWRLLRDGR